MYEKFNNLKSKYLSIFLVFLIKSLYNHEYFPKKLI